MTEISRTISGPAPTPTSPNYRLDVQGLRGIAVLLVVFYHTGIFMPGGFVGVDVFFVISGYVITGSLQREWAATGTVRLRRFYARRIRRLLPALSLATAFTVVASILLESPNGAQQQTAKTAFGASATIANFVIIRSIGDYFSPIAESNPLLHTWSLSVEEQFYLIFPVVLIAGWILGRRRRTSDTSTAVWLVVGVLAVPSFLLSLATSYDLIKIPVFGGSAGLFAFYSSLTRAWEFAIGAALALLSKRLARLPVNLLSFLGVVGGGVIVGSAFLISGSQVFPGVIVAIPVLGTSLIILSGIASPGKGSPFLRHPVLVWIGDLSYSWYLWHWPVLVFTRLHLSDQWWVLLGATVASLLPAHFSYRYIEVRCLKSPLFEGRRVLGLALVAVVIPVSLTLILALGSRSGWGLDWPIGAHEVVSSNCDEGPFDPEGCTWSIDDPKGVVLLAGDSQSWGVADGVIAASAELGYRTTVATLNGCPFVYPSDYFASVTTPGCGDFQAATLDHALAIRPAAVVIANWSLGYVADTSESQDRWISALVGVIEPLGDSGIPVVIFSSYPLGDGKSSRKSLLVRPEGNRFTDAQGGDGWHSWLLDLELDLAERQGGVFVYNPHPQFCDVYFCTVAENGVEYYTDASHLSPAGSMKLAPTFQKVLAVALRQGPSS